MTLSFGKTLCLPLAALAVVACSTTTGGVADVSEIVQGAPSGTFVQEDSLESMLGAEGVAMMASANPSNPEALASIVQHTYLVWRTDAKFFLHIVLECKTTCSERANELIPGLYGMLQWSETGFEAWGTYSLTEDAGKRFVSYKVADDAPAAAQAVKDSLAIPEEFVWDGTTLRTKSEGATAYSELPKASAGQCRDESDCMNQGLPLVRCPGKQYVCESNVCARPKTGGCQ